MSQTIQIIFSELKPEQQDILIALLSDSGFEGFEETENVLEAFINEKMFDKPVLDEIVNKIQIGYKINRVEETNWNQLWESNFQPVIVNDFVAIRAEFHEPIKNVEHEIIITPKMSFGTGHHATTYMMIEQMKGIDFNNKTVFDFGTGTGILAILAQKLGAESIVAVDNDEWSIENAFENIQKNNAGKVLVEKGSGVSGENKYDIILANINKNVILENFKSLCNHLADSGILLISGILAEDCIEIVKTGNELNMKVDKELNNNGWICLKLACVK